MASQFPKLPGYVVTHDPSIVNHKKVSHVKLEQVRNAQNTNVPLYKVPAPPVNLAPEHKNDASKSYSHNQYPNHFGQDIQEQFEPTFVKLDKQVSLSFHYFKYSTVGTPLCQCNRPPKPTLVDILHALAMSELSRPLSPTTLELTRWTSSYRFANLRRGVAKANGEDSLVQSCGSVSDGPGLPN